MRLLSSAVLADRLPVSVCLAVASPESERQSHGQKEPTLIPRWPQPSRIDFEIDTDSAPRLIPNWPLSSRIDFGINIDLSPKLIPRWPLFPRIDFGIDFDGSVSREPCTASSENNRSTTIREFEVFFVGACAPNPEGRGTQAPQRNVDQPLFITCW